MEGTDTLRRASQKLLGKKNMMITAGGVKALGRRLADIADRIDREHAEELAAEKRGLDDEAREAVERLRAIDVGECHGAICCWELLTDALETDSGYEENVHASWQNDMILTRDRLIELIENGGEQGAALPLGLALGVWLRRALHGLADALGRVVDAVPDAVVVLRRK